MQQLLGIKDDVQRTLLTKYVYKNTMYSPFYSTDFLYALHMKNQRFKPLLMLLILRTYNARRIHGSGIL